MRAGEGGREEGECVGGARGEGARADWDFFIEVLQTVVGVGIVALVRQVGVRVHVFHFARASRSSAARR